MSSSLKMPPNPDIPYGLCQCGCGQKTLPSPVTRADRYQVKGEPMRFVWGHQARKSPMPAEGFKHCRTCHQEKPHSEFYALKMKKDGLQLHCKPCSHANHRQWIENNPGRVQQYSSNYRRQKEFGILPDQYDALFVAQDGVCAICGEKNQRKNKDGSHYALTVDHCHTTGEIRGLLCNMCNPLLGYARDRIDLLQGAIAYLKKHAP